MKSNGKKRMNEKKKNGINKLSALLICLCLIGSVLTGCSKEQTTSGDDVSAIESVEDSDVEGADDAESAEGEETENVADDNANAEDEENGDAANAENDSDDSANTTYALDENLTYYADIEIADYGKIIVQLDQKSAPITVANFVSLAESGFYDGLTFHRIMEGFMMQGGDPDGNGTGGSDNTIVGEFSDNGYDNSLSHTRGAISMARSMDYDSASSQFFIVHKDSTFLDGQYAVFGYVTEGIEVVDAVCESAEPTDDNGTIESDAQPVITTITIRTE